MPVFIYVASGISVVKGVQKVEAHPPWLEYQANLHSLRGLDPAVTRILHKNVRKYATCDCFILKDSKVHVPFKTQPPLAPQT